MEWGPNQPIPVKGETLNYESAIMQTDADGLLLRREEQTRLTGAMLEPFFLTVEREKKGRERVVRF